MPRCKDFGIRYDQDVTSTLRLLLWEATIYLVIVLQLGS
jgi:hypothetical protein